MTDTIAATRPARSASAKSDDSYDDVVDMFLALHQMPAESHEYRRQRERIVARCLPLADHVARHFGRRGESHEYLTQVARVGLMNAVNRFDPTKGPSFIGFAVPTMMGEVRVTSATSAGACAYRDGCVNYMSKLAGLQQT